MTAFLGFVAQARGRHAVVRRGAAGAARRADGDQTGLVIARGSAIVSKATLVFDASADRSVEKAAKHADLTSLGIIPRETA